MSLKDRILTHVKQKIDSLSSTSVGKMIEEPFPHIFIDEFLPYDIAEEVYRRYPAENDRVWDEFAKKFVVDGKSNKMDLFGSSLRQIPYISEVIDVLQCSEMIKLLESLTNLSGVRADKELMGGGLSVARTGGFLEKHADFNWNDAIKSYRVLNLLWYMNKDWKPHHGGNIEVWSPNLSYGKTIVSSFNRAVIIYTGSTCWHGYQEVKHPEGVPRRAVNLYYYRDETIPGYQDDVPHKTKWAVG